MRLTSWIWAGPVAFIVHDAEEVAMFERWLSVHRGQLPPIAQGLAGVTTSQFAVAAAVLAAGFVLASAHGAWRAARRERSLPFMLVAGAFAANGVTHLAQAAWFGGYVPGVITAAVIVVPYSLGLGRSLVAQRLITWHGAALAVAAGAVAQLPIALLALTLARR